MATPIDPDLKKDEDEEDDDEDGTRSAITGRTGRTGRKSAITSNYNKLFEKDDKTLYLPVNLFNEKDHLLGIKNKHYADLVKSGNDAVSAQARQNCKEFAVVAFWDLDPQTDVFKCTRFFIIPDPVKRIIRDVCGTVVYQVLFVSNKTDDVYFFFDNQAADQATEGEKSILMSFIKLKPEEQEIDDIGDNRLLDVHCEQPIPIKSKSVLSTFINFIDDRPLKKQNQVPLFQIIDRASTMKKGEELKKGL